MEKYYNIPGIFDLDIVGNPFGEGFTAMFARW